MDNIGFIINIATIVFAAGGMAYSVHNLGRRMAGVETELKQLVAIQVIQGRHEERMTAMDQRVLAQGRRLDETLASQHQAQERMARMIEATISRVNYLADRGVSDDAAE